jgi:hypothetical protein
MLVSPITAYGITWITFPGGSPHCSHSLKATPLSITQRAQSFVKDSTTYVWEAEKRFKSGCLSLYKAVAAKKVEVARYESDTGGFVAGGPLVLETREVDELMALFTCMAVLNERDAFYMPGIDLGGKH